MIQAHTPTDNVLSEFEKKAIKTWVGKTSDRIAAESAGVILLFQKAGPADNYQNLGHMPCTIKHVMMGLVARTMAMESSVVIHATTAFGGIAIAGTTTVSVTVNASTNGTSPSTCFHANATWNQSTLALLSSDGGITITGSTAPHTGLASVPADSQLQSQGWPIDPAPLASSTPASIQFNPWPTQLLGQQSQLLITNSCTTPAVHASFVPDGQHRAIDMVATQPRSATNRTRQSVPHVSANMLNSTSGTVPMSAILPDRRILVLSKPSNTTDATLTGMTASELHAKHTNVKWMAADPRQLQQQAIMSASFVVEQISVCGIPIAASSMVAMFLPQAPCHILPDTLFVAMTNLAANFSQAVVRIRSGSQEIELRVPTTPTGRADTANPMVNVARIAIDSPSPQCYSKMNLVSEDGLAVLGLGASLLQSSDIILDRGARQVGIVQQPLTGCVRKVSKPGSCNGIWNLITGSCVRQRCEAFFLCTVLGYFAMMLALIALFVMIKHVGKVYDQ